MSDTSDALARAWERTVTALDVSGLGRQERIWLFMARPLAVSEDGVARLAAPTGFAKDFLDTRLRAGLADVLGRELGRPVAVEVVVQPDEPASDDAAPPPTDQRHAPDVGAVPAGTGSSPEDRAEQGLLPVADTVPPEVSREGGAPPEPAWTVGTAGTRGRDGERPEPARLNPRYSFDTFVIGSSNRFAHAAAVAVAEAPARAYNPLFVYGGSGLGKTHLLHAIGHYAQALYPTARVRYVSSEEFTNDFINSIRDDKQQTFQRRYRDADVLLVDDIQFLANKERTQEEFFHTFNTLHNQQKQIVITSDRPPQQLSTLEDRLRNRFSWGLLTDVQPPDLETRIAILRKKAASEGLAAPDDVLEFIAGKIPSNIRELEGALIRVTAFASLQQEPVTLPLTLKVLRDVIADATAPTITAGTIIQISSDYFGVSAEDLCGPSRTRYLANARQTAMYLCRELTGMSLPQVGTVFGGRDHTTVMHAERKIRAHMAEKQQVYDQVAELTALIRARGRA